MNDFSNFIVIPKSSKLLQIGFTLKKGEWIKIKQKGIDYLKKELINSLPHLKETLTEIKDFHSFVSFKSETYFVENWFKKGCVIIGDAAHCSSPLGAIGISLGLETSTSLANLICTSVNRQDFEYKLVGEKTKQRSKDIIMVHRTQKVMTKFLIMSPHWLKKIILSSLPLLSGTRIESSAKRKFLLGTNSIPFDFSFIFTEKDFKRRYSNFNYK